MEEEKIKEAFANLKLHVKDHHAGIQKAVNDTLVQLRKLLKPEPFYQTKHRDKSKDRFRR